MIGNGITPEDRSGQRLYACRGQVESSALSQVESSS
jgi:hypothetical protein